MRVSYILTGKVLKMSKSMNWEKNKNKQKQMISLKKRNGINVKRASDKQKSYLRFLNIQYSENIRSRDASILITTALHGPILNKTQTRDLIASKKNEIESFLRTKEKTL